MAPPLHPGTHQPLGPDDLAPLFPMALILQEVSRSARSRFPARCARSTRSGVPRRSSAPAAWSRPSIRPPISTTNTRASAPPARTSPTPPSPGLLQQDGRHQAPLHRDRRRPVGLVAGHGLRLLRPGVQGLHGARQLRPEALPPRHDGDLRRLRHRQPQHRDRVRPRHPRRSIPTPTARSASPFQRPSRSPPKTPTPSTPSAAC
jgi:hypothetical protein